MRMTLRATAVSAEARALSRNRSTKPAPHRAPRPSLRQSRRDAWMVMRVPPLTYSSTSIFYNLFEFRSILEHELRRVQHRPHQVLGRLPTRHSVEPPHRVLPLRIARRPAVDEQVQLL